MSEKKARITYDLEPQLLEQIDQHRQQRQPIKISRNQFISLAVKFYLDHIKKGDNKNEKIL